MKRRIKFQNSSQWQKENVLKGFEIKKESNKYEIANSQINKDSSIVIIRVDASNLTFVNNDYGYVVSNEVADENGEQKVLGQKWFKKFNVLDNVYFGNEYLVVFNKQYYKGDFDKLIEIAKTQENLEI